LLGNKLYFSLSQIILEKTLRVSLNQNTKFSLGDIINFGTVDAQKFSGISSNLVYLIATPLSTVIGLTYLYNLLGIAIFPPLFVLFILMWINFVIVKRSMHFQKEYMKLRGQRLKKTDEMFNNIRFVKANGLESFFSEKIDQARASELEWLKYIFYRIIYSITNSWFSSSVMYVLLFVCYIYTGHTLTVATIFTTLSVLRTFQDSLSYLPTVFASFVDLLISSERLTLYLASEERQMLKNDYDPASGYDLELKNINFHWSSPPSTSNDGKGNEDTKSSQDTVSQKTDLTEPLIKNDSANSKEQAVGFELKNFNIKVKKGELVAIIGKSGSGKSSLMMGLLNELQYIENPDMKFALNPNIALVSQKPWIRNDTLKANVIFGSESNQALYAQSIRFAALEEDLEILPQKDQTIIGDKGINVSGGQKVRIAIARALYQQSEVVLMDDPLSALDVNVGEFIFKNAILGSLKDKTRLIITHNISYLKHFDKIIFMDNGEVHYFGDYETLCELPAFIELKKILEETSLFKSVQEENDLEDQEEEQAVIEEPEGHESQPRKESKLAETKSVPSLVLKRMKSKKEGTSTLNVARVNFEQEINEKGEVNWRLIWSYLRLGNSFYLLVPIIGVIIFMVLSSYRYFFYNQQGKLNSNEFDKFYFIKVTFFLELGFVLIGLFRGLFVLLFGLSVASKLNTLLIFKMLHSSITGFFNKNPVGKILNRLSSDIETIDRVIPFTMIYFLNMAANIALNLILMVALSSPYLIVFMLVYFTVVIRIRSRSMKAYVEMTRVNSSAKSPITHLFSDCVNGLIDIRTNRKQSFMVQQMSKTVDFHFKTCLVLSGFGEWFRMRVTILSTLFVIPAFGFLLASNEKFMDYVSILITVIMMNMDFFIGFMNSLNNIEKNFVAFDRCNYYLNLPPENGLTMLSEQYNNLKQGVPMKLIHEEEDRRLQEKAEWPKEGRIILKDLKVKYAPELDYVLNGLSLEIKPGEKIGVIGRTGAGKTSLVTSIMRFFESVEGEINIDGVNIYQINVKQLRRSLTYISQDSYFFEGTLRENLDPLRLKTDEKIIELLKESEIYDKISLAGGLDWRLSSGGGNLSVGEKQILCFVRAIINLQKVVILDEATSNLDIKSESLLERMKEKYFKQATTITIAHRLNTVYQSDRILVLEKGRLKTFANINELTGDEMEFFNNYIKQMIL